MPSEILIFLLDEQRYALPSTLVQELVRAVEIIGLPGTSKEIEGAINYRGKIVPLLDLRHFLGRAPRVLRPTDHFIVGRVHERWFGIRVDRALEVSVIVAPSSEETPGLRGSSVVHMQDGTVIVLNLFALIPFFENDVQERDSTLHRGM